LCLKLDGFVKISTEKRFYNYFLKKPEIDVNKKNCNQPKTLIPGDRSNNNSFDILSCYDKNLKSTLRNNLRRRDDFG
jgi:hypothetical protein